MTKIRAVFMILAVVAAHPVALYAQSNVPQSTVPQSNVPQSNVPQTTADKFTIVTDAKSGGVWRLNADTGELWYCVASGQPQCHLAVNAKK